MENTKLGGNRFIRLVYGVFAAICLLLLILNVYSLISWVYQSHSGVASILLFCLTALLFAAFILLLIRTEFVMLLKNHLLFAGVLLLLSFATKVLFVLGISTPQYSDYALLYETTLEIAKGTRNYLQSPYYQLWAYQTGFPALMSGFIRLTGDNITALILINCVFTSACNVLVYYISRLKAGEKSARAVSVVYMLFPYVLGLSAVYTNQHLSTFLFYLGIYVLFRFNLSTLAAPIIAGLLLALGNSIRPEGILFVCAIVGFIVFAVWDSFFPLSRKAPLLFSESGNRHGSESGNRHDSESGNRQSRKLLMSLSVAVVSYFICFYVISQLFVVSGLNPNGLKNNFPLYKFVVGLNHETNGSYSTEDVRVLISSNEYKAFDQRDEKARDMIRERISGPVFPLARLMKEKLLTTWTARGRYPSFIGVPKEALFGIHPFVVAVGRLTTLFTLIDYLIYSLLFLILFIYSSLTAIGRLSPTVSFYPLLFAASFAVFLFIEVQYRYAYVVMPCIFIWCAHYLQELLEC